MLLLDDIRYPTMQSICFTKSPAQAAPPQATAWSVGGSRDAGSPPAEIAGCVIL